jgi:spore maturation protein CgeB
MDKLNSVKSDSENNNRDVVETASMYDMRASGIPRNDFYQMKILTIGPLWRGSNAGGLFRAMSREGCLIKIVDEFYYISLKTTRKLTKIFERLIRGLQMQEFNDTIKKEIDIFHPDIVFVYKGAFVFPSTLQYAKERKCKIALFYPDVSMTFHGSNIPQSIPLYDQVFTTKTFGITDMKAKYGINNAFFIPHGYDPEIHRKLQISEADHKLFGCDVSFIGTYSPKKEKWLAHLAEKLPDINLKIWGDQWHKASSPSLKRAIQGRSIIGDLYTLAIQCSKINLGILSEQVSGASSGDLITSRTFHIPGSSGFMLHERNEESVLYYKENEEAGFFDGPEELVSKVQAYLSDAALREKIRIAGHQRAIAEHSLDARAKTIINRLKLIE